MALLSKNSHAKWSLKEPNNLPQYEAFLRWKALETTSKELQQEQEATR